MAWRTAGDIPSYALAVAELEDILEVASPSACSNKVEAAVTGTGTTAIGSTTIRGLADFRGGCPTLGFTSAGGTTTGSDTSITDCLGAERDWKKEATEGVPAAAFPAFDFAGAAERDVGRFTTAISVRRCNTQHTALTDQVYGGQPRASQRFSVPPRPVFAVISAGTWRVQLQGNALA